MRDSWTEDKALPVSIVLEDLSCGELAMSRLRIESFSNVCTELISAHCRDSLRIVLNAHATVVANLRSVALTSLCCDDDDTV